MCFDICGGRLGFVLVLSWLCLGYLAVIWAFSWYLLALSGLSSMSFQSYCDTSVIPCAMSHAWNINPPPSVVFQLPNVWHDPRAVFLRTHPIQNTAPDDDIASSVDEASPRLKCFLRFLDLKAIEVLLLARGIKTYYGLNVLVEQDPKERRTILEGSYEIYRILGGPFPQSRQNSLNSLFYSEGNPWMEVNHDEFSLLNQFGGSSCHDSDLKRSFGGAFLGAQKAGLGCRIDICLEKLKRSHEHARASLRYAVEAYAAIFCYKKQCPDPAQWEAIKNAHRACRDLVFWCLASETYGVNKEAMRAAYERASQGIPCEGNLVEAFSKTYGDVMSGIQGGPEKSGIQVTPYAAQVLEQQYGNCGETADASLDAQAGELCTPASCSKAEVVVQAGSTSTPVSSTVFGLPGHDFVGQQTEQVPEMLTGLNQRVHRLEQFLEDNVVELLFENVQLRMHQVLDEQITAQPQ